MRDVEALCERVIIINHGKILFDGKLNALVKKYAPHRIVRVVLGKRVDQKEIEKLGEIKTFSYPEVILTVPHKNTGQITANILKSLPVEDLTIEEPDIEDVIRIIFQDAK